MTHCFDGIRSSHRDAMTRICLMRDGIQRPIYRETAHISLYAYRYSLVDLSVFVNKGQPPEVNMCVSLRYV